MLKTSITSILIDHQDFGLICAEIQPVETSHQSVDGIDHTALRVLPVARFNKVSEYLNLHSSKSNNGLAFQCEWSETIQSGDRHDPLVETENPIGGGARFPISIMSIFIKHYNGQIVITLA